MESNAARTENPCTAPLGVFIVWEPNQQINIITVKTVSSASSQAPIHVYWLRTSWKQWFSEPHTWVSKAQWTRITNDHVIMSRSHLFLRILPGGDSGEQLSALFTFGIPVSSFQRQKQHPLLLQNKWPNNYNLSFIWVPMEDVNYCFYLFEHCIMILTQ